MLYRTGADAVVIFHFCFVAFVVTGGLLVLRWRRSDRLSDLQLATVPA